MLLGAVQRLKERHHVALVRLARRGKARLVHAVVDEVVRPLVRLLDLLLQVLGVQLDGPVLLIQEVVKLSMYVSVMMPSCDDKQHTSVPNMRRISLLSLLTILLVFLSYSTGTV